MTTISSTGTFSTGNSSHRPFGTSTQYAGSTTPFAGASVSVPVIHEATCDHVNEEPIETIRLSLKEAQKKKDFTEAAQLLRNTLVQEVFKKIGTDKTRAVRDFLLASNDAERLEAFERIKKGLGNPDTPEKFDLRQLANTLKRIKVEHNHKIDPKARLIIRVLKVAGDHPEYKALVQQALNLAA
jgi:hypothetical protein